LDPAASRNPGAGFVVGTDQPDFTTVSPDGDAPAEAIRLALSFYDLARELDLQARFAFAVDDDGGQPDLCDWVLVERSTRNDPGRSARAGFRKF
jgi:hypothetical protein